MFDNALMYRQLAEWRSTSVLNDTYLISEFYFDFWWLAFL